VPLPNRTTLLLFLFFQALYALTSSGNAFRVPDEFEVYFQAEHLVDAGDISVPQALAIRRPVIVNGKMTGTQPIFFGEIGRDRKPYAPYGPLAAFFAVPHHLAARLIATAAGVRRTAPPSGIAWVFLVGGLTALTSATGAALAVAGFERAAIALGATAPTAVLWAVLLGGTTVLWPYGTTLYSEAWQAAAFVWAAALLLDARTARTHASAKVGAASLLLAIGGLTKVTSLVFAPGFLVAAACDRSLPIAVRARTVIVLAAGIAVAAAIHVTWNMDRFGRPFDFGYDWSETIPSLPPHPFLLAEVPRGLIVLLASPGKSLFLWAPVLLLSAARAREFWRREPGVAIGLAATAALGVLFYAAYQFPEGGYSHGPRNLVPIVPLLLLPAAAAGSKKWPAGIVALCAGVGLVMAVLATSVSFLEDQALGGDLGGAARTRYYERIDPPPGRPWNRYRLEYVPFVDTISSPDWFHEATLGQGPDYFPLHLLQARQQLPDGRSIPLWLVWTLPAFWAGVIVISCLSFLPIRRRWHSAAPCPGSP
jgi:hypothetical protein